MLAERSNGVDPGRPKRRTRPANGAGRGTETPPSAPGGNGAFPGAENSVDAACHSGTQPSHDGCIRACPSDAAPEETERDPLGRFAPGNKGGPVNPFARRLGMLRCALVRRIKPEAVEAIADVLIDRAKAGDVAATRLVLSYGIGKPIDAVNPDLLDLEEWDIYRRGPVSLDDLRGIVEGIPLDVVGPVVRTAKPYLNANMAETVKDVLMPEPPKRKRSRKERRTARRKCKAEAAADSP